MDGMVNGSTPELSAAEATTRARRLRLVLTDCDGVLTDGGVYYGPEGETLKRFSLRDGMGVERLREADIDCAIVTRERSPIVARRAEKLGIRLYEGVRDKRTLIAALAEGRGLAGEQLAFIGDDVNDLGIIHQLRERGLTAAPADAEPVVAAAVHLRCQRPGGQGAFREFAEWILGLRSQGRAGDPDARRDER
jgi:3-deoxy-D-manno-octulosonate 8-phosphate phosphatase (KDO 8-P phosphatase)